MDGGYEAYSLVDPFFYDDPMVTRRDEQDLAIAQAPPPAGWNRAELDDWLMYAPIGARLPAQGWKIHASTTLAGAEQVLATVWDYCVPRGIPFKFIRSKELLFLRNMKYAHRGSSGKFITIYPEHDEQFELILNELDPLLQGSEGPYILSDLRWNRGPLYVRYGGFADRWCVGSDGEPALAIEDGSGQLVEDRRGPAFEIPEWVTAPDCLAPHIAARNETTIADLPYSIESAIHFSNGGGLYRGTDKRSGEQVVMKEARPHAGLSFDKADAVTRLGRERDALQRLAGLDLVPDVKDYFTLGEHHFLVTELIDGEPLHTQMVERYPLTYEVADEMAAAEYTEWALTMARRVEEAIETVHSRGLVFGDVHPSNVLVRPDGRITLIDLEVASDAGEERPTTLAAHGFMAPAGCVGVDLDRYALACLRFFLFMPLNTLISSDPRKARQLATAAGEHFPVPGDFLAEAVDVIEGASSAQLPSAEGSNGDVSRAPSLDRDRVSWRAAIDSMAEGILASATPERDDRLFPGDVRQFAIGGLGIGYGAAGVLYALDACGCGRYPAHEQWLVERALKPETGARFGLYDGLHGVAYVLERLGRRDAALEVLGICVEELQGKWDRWGLSLSGGLAGIGLNLAHFGELLPDASLRELAWEIADVVGSRLGGEEDVAEISGGEHPYAGLVRGSSGPALLFIRLYEQSGDDGLLDLAATALRQDLRRCTRARDGSLEVNEGWRMMPYLADGSAGIGLVLDEYLAHREDESFASAAEAIRKAARAGFYIEPGVFYGRAGMILHLAHGAEAETADGEAIADQVAYLDWHAMDYQGRLAFPGENLLRLSMDLASGTAGVMLAVAAAVGYERAHLPFLPALRTELASTPPELESIGERG